MRYLLKENKYHVDRNVTVKYFETKINFCFFEFNQLLIKIVKGNN